MSEVNSINKISVKSSININRINMTTLLFIDNLAVSKTRYSLLNKYINILESSSESLSLYHNLNSCDYYEYQLNLQQNNTTVSGFDRFGYKLQDLDKKNIIVFVNGYKLLTNEFQVASKNSIIIFPKFVSERISTVIIYASEKLSYCGKVFEESTWNPHTCEFVLEDYTENRYIFFKNGEQINYDNITKLKKYVKLDFLFEKTDIIEYYKLPNDTSAYVFIGMPGYLSYGPIDKHRKEVPVLYDASILFESPVRLIIDDVREGFFIKEEKGTGSLMFIANDFDTREIKAIVLTEFSKKFYKYNCFIDRFTLYQQNKRNIIGLLDLDGDEVQHKDYIIKNILKWRFMYEVQSLHGCHLIYNHHTPDIFDKVKELLPHKMSLTPQTILYYNDEKNS